MVNDARNFTLATEPGEEGMRLDLFLVRRLPEFTRSVLERFIGNGLVLVNGNRTKSGYRLRKKDCIEVTVPPPEPVELVPEKVEFSILAEDASILVLAKPPGVVVHPAAGHKNGTLVHGLLHHCASLPGLAEGRPGIVHRLDKDTSGVMLAAKTERALKKLTEDFRNRKIRKVYHAILLRSPREDKGRIDADIGRHPVNRKKMAVVRSKGRHAATNWRIVERFGNGMCLAEMEIETGRTHQIRVHMASLGCPVAGDGLYGGKLPPGESLRADRQLLHSSALGFVHPDSGLYLTYTATLWPDMQQVLDVLRRQWDLGRK
jgi:23S rRNA pseudouridine1911/1915/1917 synthase